MFSLSGKQTHPRQGAGPHFTMAAKKSISLNLAIRPGFLVCQAAKRTFEHLYFYARCPVGHPSETHNVTTMLAFHYYRLQEWIGC